jgi:GTP pyrophosphokinase
MANTHGWTRWLRGSLTGPVLAALFSAPAFASPLCDETLAAVAPTFERAGLGPAVGVVQDEMFQALHPARYEALVAARDLPSETARMEAAQERVSSLLASAGLVATVDARVKSNYSLDQKMQKKNLELDEVLDRVALRVRVATDEQAYEALTVLHQGLAPIDGAQDDYIAQPKPNGYRSLHTAVLEPTTGGPVELQVRTHQMHEVAEHGPAAHWAYKAA